MTPQQIQTLGHFLANYRTDLIFLLNFQRNKSLSIVNPEYLQKSEGSFYKFLIDYKVIRNIKKGKAEEVFIATKAWIKSSKSKARDVDGFAEELARLNLTHDNKIMTSLSSKILFLNNPYEIFPLDMRVKESLHHDKNGYADYLKLLKTYIGESEKNIGNGLKMIGKYASILEKPFIDKLHDIEIIRRNRFIDKVLWIGLVEKGPQLK